MPEAKGFNRWVWLMPIVFVIVGFFVVRAVLQSWRRRAAQLRRRRQCRPIFWPAPGMR